MKHVLRLTALALLLVLCLGAGQAKAADAAPPAALYTLAYQTEDDLAASLGMTLDDFIVHLYTPAHPQPLCAYLVTAWGCEFNLKPVRETGLQPPLTTRLEAWAAAIMAQSDGLIRFVNDPDYADILVFAGQYYDEYATYTSSLGWQATGYACTVQLDAYHLTDLTDYFAFLTETQAPAQSEYISGPGDFWKNPPELEGSEKMARFVRSILWWYGFENYEDSWFGDDNPFNSTFATPQQALIARGYLAGEPSGAVDEATVAAIRRFQADHGIRASGVIGRATLAALYRDADTVAAVLALYPEEAPHEEPAPTDTPTPSPAPTETAKSGPAIGTPDHANDKENSKKKGK